jgi:hypothetical protein
VCFKDGSSMNWTFRNVGRIFILVLVWWLSIASYGQDDEFKPVPILTGSTGYFARDAGGQVQNAPTVTPLILAPIGDKWLIEAKGNYTDTFARGANGSYQGASTYGLNYAQADYIANRYVTVVAGRFLVPFGIYGERLAPNWIRVLQTMPLTVPITSGTGLGGMVRGGFSLGSSKVELNYAGYYSAGNTNHITATDRCTGGRLGFFLPGPRLEIGGSIQEVLRTHTHSAGMHFEWQPNATPLTVRSEVVRSSGLNGSGYWIESAYRLSRIPQLRRLEAVGRTQQFFADSKLTPALVQSLGPLGLNTNEGDFGLNYYFNSDVRASASYGRQFAHDKDANLWVMGVTYRFVLPLGPKGGAF